MRVAAPDRIDFLGLHFDALDAAAVRRSVVALARSSSFSYVVTPNVDHIVQLHRSPDPAIIRIYDAAALCICDSRIIARLAAFSGISLAAVPGSDVTRDLLCGELPDCRVAVIGGDSELHRNLEALYPRFAWSFYMPPMGVRRDPEARDAIALFVEAMQAAMRKALNTDELKNTWNGLGTDSPNVWGDDFGKFVSSEVKRWAEVVKASGAKLD